MDEYWTSKVATRPEHIRDIRFDGTVHNNKMERMNGEIRDRRTSNATLEKKTAQFYRAIKSSTTTYDHTWHRGKTPAEAAGIEVKGKNKWLTLIQNASNKSSVVKNRN